MTERIQGPRSATALLACIMSLAMPIFAADGPGDDSAKPSEIEQLKKMLVDQQHQIDELRRLLLENKTGDFAATHPSIVHPAAVNQEVGKSLGEVASTTPAMPPAPIAPPTPIMPPVSPAIAPPQGDSSSPLQLKIGDAYITPVGFMDMTSVSRSTNTGNGIGTNFGGIPYGNTQTGALTETRLSIQNSRIGARFDAMYHDWKILGYWESDFLGQLGNPPNGGLAVSSNPYVFRMRL